MLKEPRSYALDLVYVSPELKRVHVLWFHKYDESDKEFLRHWKQLHIDRVPPHQLAPLSGDAEFSGLTVFSSLDELGYNQPLVQDPQVSHQAGYRREGHFVWWTYPVKRNLQNPSIALSYQQWRDMVQCRERWIPASN